MIIIIIITSMTHRILFSFVVVHILFPNNFYRFIFRFIFMYFFGFA